MDPRREVRQIWKHMDGFQGKMGEALIWYKFDPARSHYDRVYDEGSRVYERGIRIPILWVDQTEATEDYAPEGRRPTQRIRFAIQANVLFEAGISVTEAHGNRLQDSPTKEESGWHDDRNHDIIYFDGRYYEISGFQIRGRVKGEDVIIGVSGIESFPSDDMHLDAPPGSIHTPVPS